MSGFLEAHFIPAFCGMGIITLMPYFISILGAVNMTIFTIAGQIITSVIWNLFVEKMPLNSLKTLGLAMAGISISLIVYSNYK